MVSMGTEVRSLRNNRTYLRNSFKVDENSIIGPAQSVDLDAEIQRHEDISASAKNWTMFESYVIALDQRQEICSESNLILGKSLSPFHSVVQSSGLKIL